MPAVVSAIKGVTGVLDVHDLHVWMVGPGVVACSCHIVVAEQSVREGQQVLRAVVDDIEHRFHITQDITRKIPQCTAKYTAVAFAILVYTHPGSSEAAATST